MDYMRTLIAPYKHLLKQDTAEHWLNLSRKAYGLSCLALFFFYFEHKFNKKPEDEKLSLLDHSSAHRKLRLSNAETGLIPRWSWDSGFHFEEYHREYYLQTLEMEAQARYKREQFKRDDYKEEGDISIDDQ